MAARLARRLSERELALALSASVLSAGLAYIGSERGLAGMLLPLALIVLVVLMMRPVAMVALTTGLVILCEGPDFGLFASVTSKLYDGKFFHEIAPIDILVGLTIVSVGMGLIRERRRVQIPRPLLFAEMLLAFAMLAGLVTGRAAGNSLRSEVLAELVLMYLLLLPIAVANLSLSADQVTRLIWAGVALAIFKAVIGMIEILGHHGVMVEGRTLLTYYEATANWTIMCALLGLVALGLSRVRPPTWALAGVPLLIACLLLSYRRSFWIATVLALLLLALLASSASGRRLFIPAGLLLAVAIWGVSSSANLQNSSSPIVQRVASLTPSKLESNAEDSYRLDERTNVIAEIEAEPVTGLGLLVPWSASHRTLSVEHESGREYVHFAALWFWLKLGILGLFAYVAMLAAGVILAVRVWRAGHGPAISAFGLMSATAIVGLAVMETTATFTGVEARFTVVLGTQIGLLALLSMMPAREEAQTDEPESPGADPDDWLASMAALRG